MRIGLILPTNLYFAPYCKIYTDIFDEKKIEYDVIFWDRELLGEDGGIAFRYKSPISRTNFRKFLDYYLFSRFVKKKINEYKFDRLIIFGPQIGVFIYNFLKKEYKNNFVLDYRDLSIEQKFPNRFKKLLDISSLICISSPGFLNCLPNGYDYILSHNFDIRIVREVLKANQIKSKELFKEEIITISTIGGIRDYIQNVELITSLKNEKKFIIKFIGKGVAEDDLKKYTIKNSVLNVDFFGYYNKIEEDKFYKLSDIINIYYPRLLSHETALSNRFYNGIIYKRPMLVTNNSIQGKYVEKYNLGISVQDCNNLKFELINFIEKFDQESFIVNCNYLLESFEKDYEQFELKLLKYLN